jgi:predicted small lipoprotein YifL
MMRPIIFLILTHLLLTACGSKGPLYLPEQRYPQTQQDSQPKADSQPKQDSK